LGIKVDEKNYLGEFVSYSVGACFARFDFSDAFPEHRF
jgi:hypothetical protein